MALMTPDQFEESLKDIHPRVFMNGKLIENVLENPITRTVVESNKASYAWALDDRYKDIMTCSSSLIGERINRYTNISSSINDLRCKGNLALDESFVANITVWLKPRWKSLLRCTGTGIIMSNSVVS